MNHEDATARRGSVRRRCPFICAALIVQGPLSCCVAADPVWHQVPPLRQFAAPQLGRLLPDIESRMPAGHIYRNDGDPVNWAHETTHAINSRVRNHPSVGGNGQVNAFYIGGGRVAIVREPRVRKSWVGPLVPAVFRDRTWAEYVNGQWDWEAQPLYLVDEWTAYANGTEVGIQLAAAGVYLGSESTSVENMLEFAAFACCLLRLVDQRDPGYIDRAVLADYVAFGLLRSLDLARQAQSLRGLASPRGRMLISALEAEYLQ